MRNTLRTSEPARVITVGPQDADVIGTGNRAIQIALDAMAHQGGGTVHVHAGTYVLSDSIQLRSHVQLIGDRRGTILQRAPVVRSTLAVDADVGEHQITPADAARFHAGMGLMLRGGQNGGEQLPPLTVTHIDNGVMFTNNYIPANHSADAGFVVSYFAMIRGFDVEDAVVDGFTIEAGADDVTDIDDIRIGGVMLTRCRQCVVRNVTVSGTLGDGILAEPSQDITVERCEAFGNTHHGVHFGSHSPGARTIDCDLHDNGSDGLYLCWGVRHGIFRGNHVYANGFRLHRNGICLGHKDTDNLIEANDVHDNAKHGICFRTKTEANGAHRNVLRGNTIRDNGRAWQDVPAHLREFERAELLYAGVFVNGITHDLQLQGNTIRETRSGDERLQFNAVYLGPGVTGVTMTDNIMQGHTGDAVVDESGATEHQLQ